MAAPLLTARPSRCSSHMFIKQLSQTVTDSNSNRTVVIIRNTSILVTQPSARKMNSHGQKLSLYQRFGRAMVQRACHVRSQARPCGIYGEQSSIEIGFASSTSVSPSKYRSTIAAQISNWFTSHPHYRTSAIISVVK